MSRRCLGHDWVEVGIRKPIVLDALQEPEKGCCVYDVRGLHLASTADTSTAVSDDRARIAGDRENPRLVLIGEESALHQRLVSAIVEVLANKREDAGSAAYGDAVLYD